MSRGKVKLRKLRQHPKSSQGFPDGASVQGAVFNAIRDGVVTADIKTGKIVSVNPGACRLFGYSSKEFLTKSISHLHPAAEFRKISRLFLEQASQRKKLVSNISCIKKDGTIFFVDITTNVVLLGNRRCLVGLFRDITDRKKSEETLQENAEAWQTTFNSVNDAVWLLSPEGRILRTNQAAYKLFGKAPSEILGRRCCEVVHGTAKPPLECPLRRMRKSLHRESWEFLLLGRWFRVSVDPVLDKKGSLSGAVHIVSDITDRKRALENLRNSEEQYRNLFESSHDAMMTLAPPSWKFTSANSAMVRMFKAKSKTALFSHSPWALSPKRQPDGRLSFEKARAMIRKAVVEGVHFFEWTHKRINGELFPAEVLLTRVEKEKEKEKETETETEVFLQATIRDISARKSIEDQRFEFMQKLEAVFENTFQFIALLSSEGKVLKVNRSALDFGGLTLREVQNKFFWNCPWWTLSSKTQQGVKKAVALAARGKFVRYPVEVVGKRGLRKIIDFSMKPAQEKIGKAMLLVAEGRDITDQKRAEETLSRREASLTAIIENQPGITWLKDTKGRFLLVNRAFAKACGMGAPERLVGKTDLDIWPLKLARKYRDDDRRVMEQKKPFAFEEPVLVQGMRKWHQTFKTAVRDAAGKVIGTTGYGEDITERKNAAEVLRKSEARFRRYFETPLIGVAITSPQKGWVDVNNKLCSLLGYSRKELVRRTWAEMTHPDDLAADMSQFKRLLAGEINQYVIDKRFIRKDGGIIWVNLGVSCIRKADGGVDFVVALLRDITRRKQTEAKLNETIERLRALSENLADGMVYQLESDLIGKERKFTFISPAVKRMHGVREEDALRDPAVIYDQVPSESRALLAKQEVQAAKKMQTLEFETTVKLPSGKIRWGRFISSPRKSPDGRRIIWDGIEFDITQHKKAEEELRKAALRITYLSRYSNDFIILLDEKFKFLETNHRVEDVYGYTRKELLGMHATQLRAPEARSAFFKQMKPVENSGKVLYETVHQTKNGRKFPVEISIHRFFVNGRKFYQAVIRDISERRESEKTLRLAQVSVARANDSIYWIKSDGSFVYVNDGACRMLGYSRKELLKMGVYDIDPNFPKKKWPAHWKELQKKKHLRFESINRVKTGRIFPIECSANYFEFEGEAYNFSYVRDISERQKIEQELKEAKGRLEYVLGATKTGVDIIDRGFNLRYVDPAWEKKYGSFKGKKCHQYFMGRKDMCPGCGIPQALKTKKTTITEEILVRENNRVVEVHTIPFQDEKGEWLVAEFNIDITDRKRIQEALEENQRQLREIIDTVPHMIFAQDRQGRFLLVNQATGLAYGKKPEDLVGIRRKDIHPVAAEAEVFLKDHNEVWASGKAVLRAGESFTDIRGRKHILESIKIPFKMAGTGQKAVLGVSVDMTEQKKVEDFRNDVIRTISHELRTPLSIEKGAITLILDGLADGEVNAKQRELLLMVLHNIERLSRLIDNLLDVSRIESGKLKIHPQDEDLARIVRDAVFENKKRASDKNLQLKMSLPEQTAEIYADRDKIFQVVSNLIDNALKFTEQGVIELSVKVFEKEVECSVQDTGIGITQQNIGRIFEKFHQFSRIPGAGEKGLGLGLTICKGFIEAHGGKIWLKSRPGMGTRVTFVLPRKRPTEIPAEKGA